MRLAAGSHRCRELGHSLKLLVLLVLLLLVGCGDAYLNLFISQSQVKKLLGLCHSQDPLTVSTRSGKIKGHYRTSFKGNNYEAYEGIPYALPPTGERRFKPPQPIPAWSGELTATKFKEHCIGLQRVTSPNEDNIDGVEDCLYLNVYVPSRKTNDSLAVIFWLYGGAFQYSTLEGIDEKYLIDYNLIFVSLNYRHGALGFLSTEDGVVPGNMGLKDQSIALRWVSENIEFFGGDPKRVTIAGLSAGGASVHYHYLSPMSAGLFHSGLSFSGTAFDCWTQAENSREKALRLGELLNCPTHNTRHLVQCLRERPAREIVEAQAEFMPWHLNEFTPFGPVVETFSKDPFIDRSPIDIIKSGDALDVPWITGVVSEEGLYPVAEFATNKSALQDLDENWESIAPHLLHYYYTIPKEQHASVARKIRKHYFGDKPINRANLLILTHLVSDRVFIVDAEKAARAQAEANRGPVWLYYYSYRANTSLTEFMTNTTDNYGVSHGDDVLLVLGNPIIDPTRTPKDLKMQKVLIQFWTSVANEGKPNFEPRWQKVDTNSKSLNLLHFTGPDDVKQEKVYNLGEKSFWNTINFNENKI